MLSFKDFKNLNRLLVDRAVSDFAHRLPNGMRLVDIGAGTGHYRKFFDGQHYIAIDRGYESRSMSGLDIFGDVMSMPFPDASMDGAICVEVIEHILLTDRFLAEVSRIVRPGGLVLLTSPLCSGEHMVPYDFYRFTRYSLEEHISKAGFIMQSIQPRGGFFVLLAYLVARVPDELFRANNWKPLSRMVKPIVRLVTTYFVAPILFALDRFDEKKHSTLGYICVLRRTDR